MSFLKIFKQLSIATSFIILLNACTTVGPDYKRPDVDVQGKYNTDGNGVKTEAVTNDLWWKSFNDPVLDKLIDEGYHHNLNLQSTGVNVLKARAELGQSVGELYPQQQDISGYYTQESLGSGNRYQDAIPDDVDYNAVTLGASWELDFWGKYRRAIRANDAAFLSSLDAYNDALVSLTADIGSSYVAIRMYQAQLDILNKSIDVYKQSLQAVKVQYANGQASLTDVTRSLSSLNQIQASLPGVKTSLQKEKDSLAVLIGTTPDKIDDLIKEDHVIIPVAPKNVSVGLPKDLLLQRPDVQEAELQAMSQSEAIGAIKAELYPAFSLNGSFGYSSSNVGDSSTSDIFQWSNHTVSIGPSLYIPIFNYGQISNQVRAQDAEFQKSIFNYENTVLKAQQEVQDGIVSYVEAENALDSMTAANLAALKTVKLTLVKYQMGAVDYNTLLNAQKQQLNVAMSLANSQGSVPQGLISLYRALGGGWQIDKGHDVVSDEVKKQMEDRTDWGDLLEDKSHQAPKTEKEKIDQTVLPSW